MNPYSIKKLQNDLDFMNNYNLITSESSMYDKEDEYIKKTSIVGVLLNTSYIFTNDIDKYIDLRLFINLDQITFGKKYNKQIKVPDSVSMINFYYRDYDKKIDRLPPEIFRVQVTKTYPYLKNIYMLMGGTDKIEISDSGFQLYIERPDRNRFLYLSDNDV